MIFAWIGLMRVFCGALESMRHLKKGIKDDQLLSTHPSKIAKQAGNYARRCVVLTFLKLLAFNDHLFLQRTNIRENIVRIHH